MAYYLTDTPTAGRGRRRLLVAIAAGLIVLVGLALLVRPTGGRHPVAAAPAAAEPALSWALVGEQPVPTSPRAGPARTDGGVAAGFTHDELGAVLAAVHIAARLNVDVGPDGLRGGRPPAVRRRHRHRPGPAAHAPAARPHPRPPSPPATSTASTAATPPRTGSW